MTQTIKFFITAEKADLLTWEEMESLMEGNIGRARKVLARFLVDEAEQPVEFSAAMQALGALTLPQIKEAVAAFSAAMKDSAVNPTNAGK